MSNQTQMILASVFIAMYLILTAFSLWATISEYMSKNTVSSIINISYRI